MDAKQSTLWKSALRKFEVFRLENKCTIEAMFNLLSSRGTSAINRLDFVINLKNLIHDISDDEARDLANILDSRHSGSIQASKLATLIENQIGLHDISEILDSHPIFPKWLISRSDFQSFFFEWSNANVSGGQNDFMIERICKMNGEERKPADLQTLIKWMKGHKILQHVKQNRLLDVCRNLQMLECPAGTRVITQGEPGDAFYIVVSGTLKILVDGMHVNTVHSGMYACNNNERFSCLLYNMQSFELSSKLFERNERRIFR